MVEHIWSVLCQSSVIDSDSNNISIHNVLEQVNIQGIPPGEGKTGVVPQAFQIVSLFSRTELENPSSATCRMKIRRPNGDITKEFEFDADLTQKVRMRYRNIFSGLGIFEAGLYRFDIEIKQSGSDDWKSVARIPLEVQFVASENSL